MAANYAVTTYYSLLNFLAIAAYLSGSMQMAYLFFSEFYVCLHLSLRVLFIAIITLAVNNDDDRY